MTTCFNHFQKTSMARFRFFSPFFWAKRFLSKSPPLLHTTSYDFLTPCQNLEKNNQLLKNGWTDGQILFYTSLPATAGGLKRTFICTITYNIISIFGVTILNMRKYFFHSEKMDFLDKYNFVF